MPCNGIGDGLHMPCTFWLAGSQMIPSKNMAKQSHQEMSFPCEEIQISMQTHQLTQFQIIDEVFM
jgi:hypothetical protein